MASQGPNSPSAASSGAGNTWSSPTNVYSSNNSYATSVLPGGNTSADLIISNFGFSIPSGATIDGIVVEIEGKDSLVNTYDDLMVLTKTAGSGVGTNHATGDSWSNVDSIRTYGGSADLWGTTWTDSEVNASGFGLVYRVANNSFKGDNTVYIDHARITVYYTSSGGGPTSASSLLLAGD